MNVKVVERKDFLRYLLLMNETQRPSVFVNRLTRLSTLLGLLFLLCFSSNSYAQDDLNLHGVIADAMTSAKIEGVKITVMKDGANYESYTTRANGKYEFYLDCGASYKLVFHKDGFVDRSILIDSRNVPEEAIGAGIIMPTDMSMYEITEAMKDMDMSVFEEPIGKASYNPEEQDLSWDFGHTTKVKADIFAFIREVEKKQKELDKENSAENKAANALEEKFNEFVEAGDVAMPKKKYQDAVLNYKAALELKVDPAVQAKLGDAETKYNDELAAQSLEDDFSAALDAGDGFMRTEEYEKAIEQYEAALALKSGESYPTEQIALAQKTLEDQAANMANQEKFNQLVSDGDGLVTEKKYEDALVPYKEARALLPDNREIIRKIDETELAIKTLADKAERQAEYDELVATADAAFQSEDYEAAKASYAQASSVFEDEAYPKDQLAICEAKMNELANAAEMQAKYDKAMAAGSAAMTEQNYTAAITSFEEALTAKSGDPTATAKIEEANGMIAELEAEANKQANYDSALAEADELFDAESYVEAKTKYQAAKEIIPEEVYPTEQISKIDKLIAENAELAAADEAYNTAMVAGQTAIESTSYAEAITQFQAALAIKVGDKDATQKLEEATTLKQEQDANAELNESYQALIDGADVKFADQDLNGAKTDYQAALELKNENYPTEQLALIETMIAEMASEAEAAARQEELQAEYDAHMKSGDEALTAKGYDDAITSFTAALSVMPDDAVASTKLEEAEAGKQSMMDAAAIEDQYKSKIDEADKLFEGEEYAEAKAKYESAQLLIPGEVYPGEQISIIDVKLAELAELAAAGEAYDNAMAAGETAMESTNYGEAITQFQGALTLRAEDKDATKKLEEATALKQEQDANTELNESYQALIDGADMKFADQDLDGAKADYQAALELKSENYPSDQLALIETMVAEMANEAEAAAKAEELQAAYDAHIKSGDESLTAKRYDDAITSFTAALKVIPDDAIATVKLEEANAIKQSMMDVAAIDELYQSEIAKADELFEAEDWDAARSGYEAALKLKSEEAYPVGQIEKIEFEIAALAEAEVAALQAIKTARIAALVAEGDAALAEDGFETAVDKYEEAYDLDRDRADIQAKIDVANEKLLAYLENQSNKDAYDAAIAEGNKLFEQANWAMAKSSFEQALEIYASETYPKSKIEEIDVQLALLLEQQEAERQAGLMAEFNQFIEAGDKRFNRKKYDKALEEYEAALSLIPDNQIAKEKIASVNDILMKSAEDTANQNAYASAIDDADAMFKSGDLEMAKMKYADAQVIMPDQAYPGQKITEIEMLLERRRLDELANDAAALEAEYQAALRTADAFLNEKNYIQAIDGYEAALDLKMGEQYPLGQLERIELLMEDEMAAAEEAARLAAYKAEKAAKAEARNSKQTNVNTNSEEQAEQFMREAREAQEREKYERLKAEKEALNERLYSYEQQSRAQRMSVELSHEYYSVSNEERYSAAVLAKQNQTKSSVDYKETLLRNQERQGEMGKVRTDYAYEEVEKIGESRESQMRESAALHETKRGEAHDANKQQLLDVEQLSSSSVDDRMAYNDAMQARAEEMYAQNRRAEELRNERAKELVEMSKDREEYQRSLSERNIDDIRAKSEQQRANLQAYEEDSEARSKDKINANARAIDQQKNSHNSSMTDSRQRADEQREKNAREVQNTNQGKEKDYDEYFRSQLANNYPQGVSEESSTLGNKVIITRIVVRGNRGDEYKKVVDKAGKYYFKNGRSISENTWDRETLQAFNKSRD